MMQLLPRPAHVGEQRGGFDLDLCHLEERGLSADGVSFLDIAGHASKAEDRAESIEGPERECTLDMKPLSKGWDDPMWHPEVAELGDTWRQEAGTIALRVPSAVVPRG